MKISRIIPAVKQIVYKTKPQDAKYIREALPPIRIAVTNPVKSFNPVENISGNQISLEGVKKLFPDGKIEADFLRHKMYEIKKDLFLSGFINFKNFKKWLHSVNLSKKLKQQDYQEITEFMNLHDGRFLSRWLGCSNTDLTPNVQKLALFVRSIKRIDRLNMYKNLPEEKWLTCVDGIVNRPDYAVEPLMRYKYSSRAINQGISNGYASEKVQNYIKSIEKFLNTQVLKSDMNLYRGEGDFRIFNKVVIDKEKNITLQSALEKFTAEIEGGKCSEEEIKKFIYNKILPYKIEQERFLSTTIEPEAGERYAQTVFWHIKAPKGTKGSMIESYNVERESEAEILMQKGTNLLIKKANFNKLKNRWELWAELVQ